MGVPNTHYRQSDYTYIIVDVFVLSGIQ